MRIIVFPYVSHLIELTNQIHDIFVNKIENIRNLREFMIYSSIFLYYSQTFPKGNLWTDIASATPGGHALASENEGRTTSLSGSYRKGTLSTYNTSAFTSRMQDAFYVSEARLGKRMRWQIAWTRYKSHWVNLIVYKFHSGNCCDIIGESLSKSQISKFFDMFRTNFLNEMCALSDRTNFLKEMCALSDSIAIRQRFL